MEEMTEKERKDTRMAALYELRLLVKASEKDSYTKEELMELFDTVAQTQDA